MIEKITKKIENESDKGNKEGKEKELNIVKSSGIFLKVRDVI